MWTPVSPKTNQVPGITPSWEHTPHRLIYTQWRHTRHTHASIHTQPQPTPQHAGKTICQYWHAMFFTLFPWFPLYSINRPVKLTCKFKLSLSFLLCNSWTVCIKIYLIPLWHKHSSHWDLWGKKGHRNRMPQSERKCVPWIMSTNNFQWDCHCRGQRYFMKLLFKEIHFSLYLWNWREYIQRRASIYQKGKLLQWRHQQHFTYCTKSWNERQEYAIFLCFQRIRIGR